MERLGLVGQVEQDLERSIAQGLLPRHGTLPSEHSLARYYGVSRTTVREALKRLAARDLVEQHPGRRSRAVPMDVAVTLENLSVVLHQKGPAQAERRRLLEGLFALKRETTIELLAACCEHASAQDMEKLKDLSFQLSDSPHWEPKPGKWAGLEFELLRVAAQAVNRPGQELLLQSLERSYRGMAQQLLPLLNAKAIRKWALYVFGALMEKDASKLRRELPALLQASDAFLLEGLAPLDEPTQPSQTSHSADTLPSKQPPAEEDAKEGVAETILTSRSDCRTGSYEVPPTGSPSLQAPSPDADAPPRDEVLDMNTSQGPQEPPGRPLGQQKPLTQVLAGSGDGARLPDTEAVRLQQLHPGGAQHLCPGA